MRLPRFTLTWLVVLGVLALFGASSALAAGPSAGDQQYVDPLTGSTTPSSHSNTPSSSSSTASPTPTASSSSATSSSTASTATGTASTGSTATSAATLPRTGYDGWLAAAIGAGLVGAGLAIRRQAFSR
jgi:cytoskeletal protein RodZ